MSDKGRDLEKNKRQGRWGEKYGDDQLIIQGYEIEETGIGSDRHITKRDLYGNVVEEKLIDYKTGKAKLSKRQKEDGAEEYEVWVPPFSRDSDV